MPPADDHLGHARDIGGDAGGEEPHEDGLMQGDAGQRQQPEGSQNRSDGNPAAVTHVAHVAYHP
ncbi:hypothetical protein ABIB51_003385 [Arthrobacter sp. UYCu712]